MPEPIAPITSVAEAAKLFGDDFLAEASMAQGAAAGVPQTSDPFQVVFDNVLKSLEGVSAAENRADVLTEAFVAGKVDTPDVMIAMAKANLAVQFAVTTVTTAVNTFKELTQIQI